jgi:hypothetical protein
MFRNPIQVRSNTGNQWQSSCGSGRTTASRNTSASPGPVSHLSTRLDTLVCPVETCAQPHSITQLQAAQKVNLAGYYTYYALLCNIVQFQCSIILLILEAWIIIAQVDWKCFEHILIPLWSSLIRLHPSGLLRFLNVSLPPMPREGSRQVLLEAHLQLCQVATQQSNAKFWASRGNGLRKSCSTLGMAGQMTGTVPTKSYEVTIRSVKRYLRLVEIS